MAVLALAFVMNLSGQTITLGTWMAGAGGAFALLSPLLGWLGVAVTGSDTSSNSLFGALQVTAANQAGLSDVLMAASNSSGGVLGKMISPQNLAIAAAAVGMDGKEGDIFRRVVAWSLVFLAVLCVLSALQASSVVLDGALTRTGTRACLGPGDRRLVVAASCTARRTASPTRVDLLGGRECDDAAPESASGHPRAQRSGQHRGVGDQVDVAGGDLEVVAHRRLRRSQDLTHRDEVGIAERGNGIEHALVIGQDVAGAPRVDRVGAAVQRRHTPVLHVAQRGHPEIGRGAFTRRPARRVLTAGVTVWCTRIDQQQSDPCGIGIEGAPGARRLAEVDHQRAPGLTAQRGQLIHQAGRRADVVVLRALREPRLLDAVELQARGGASAPRTAHSSAADDETPEPISTSLVIDIVAAADRVARRPQRPHHPGDVRRPARHVAGSGIERDPHRAVLPVAADGDHGVVASGLRRSRRCARAGDRQRETQVVVGVLADQVDPARRRVSDSRSSTAPAAVAATLSGVTSLMNASIADSEPARNFSLVALRRTDISSTWK